MRAALILLATVATGACSRPAPEFDVLIVGGDIYDGSGGDGTVGNIGILGDRIATMNAPGGATASVTIDATGLVVMPGFIDPHTHALSGRSIDAPIDNTNYLAQGVTTVFVGSDGVGVAEPAISLLALDSAGLGANIAWLAGHGRLRDEVMGMEDRPASAAELARMRALLDERMSLGAFGLSTGLFYAPGSFAGTEEVVALAKVAAEHGGVYDTHLRDESSYNIGLLASVEETLEIARGAGIPVHISHIKALGKDVWGASADVIAKVEAAREEGLDVTANQYPWRASGTRFSNAILPRWAAAEGYDPAGEAENPELREAMESNLERRGGPDSLLVTAADSPYRGKRLSDIAEIMDMSPIDAALALARGDDPSIASFVMSPADVDAFAVQPWVMTGSDGSSGHPRLYGSYPKAWQDLVETGTLSRPVFARRSAGLVAETFRICGRGLLRDGYFADIVIFDPASFVSNATYENPTELASGVRALVVNGTPAIVDGVPTQARSGRVLRKTTKDCSTWPTSSSS